MPLSREIAYWDIIASQCVRDGHLYKDNVAKRQPQISRLLKYEWLGQKVLEIGTGNGVVAGILKMVVQGHFSYLGTELSDKFRVAAKTMFQLEVVEADVRELPGNGYTRIIAFDSLEHVRPEHREEGYSRIFNAAADGALLFIHYSYGVSYHDKEFDHPFGLEDLVRIEAAGFKLLSYERYDCLCNEVTAPYAFVVMQK